MIRIVFSFLYGRLFGVIHTSRYATTDSALQDQEGLLKGRVGPLAIVETRVLGLLHSSGEKRVRSIWQLTTSTVGVLKAGQRRKSHFHCTKRSAYSTSNHSPLLSQF